MTQKRRKCQTCRGTGAKTKFKSILYSVPMACMTCGGTGFVGGKR